jgi:hypothetical protein
MREQLLDEHRQAFDVYANDHLYTSGAVVKQEEVVHSPVDNKNRHPTGESI